MYGLGKSYKLSFLFHFGTCLESIYTNKNIDRFKNIMLLEKVLHDYIIQIAKRLVEETPVRP